MTRLMDDVSIQDYSMAFDHGSPTVIPANVILIAMTAIVWSQVVTWWIIAPICLVLLFFAMDYLSGMFFVLGILAPTSIMSPGLVGGPRHIQDGRDVGDFATSLTWGLGKIAMVVIVEFGLVILGVWILDRKLRTANNTLHADGDTLPDNQTDSAGKE